MNKSQLVDALAERLGDRRTAASAVDALLQIVVDTVRSGDSVSITGFGVFESRARAARTGRNPRTGEVVEVPATTVPAFRAGTGFRSAVADEAGGAAAPSRRAAPAAATGGSRSVNGSTDVATPEIATVLDTAPVGEAAPAKGRKKAAKSAAAKETAAKETAAKETAKALAKPSKAAAKDAAAKDAAAKDAAAKDAGKDGKKPRKGKK